MTEGFRGLVIGDKGYLGAWLQAELAAAGINLQTPLRANMTDLRPPWVVRQLANARRLVETVIGQLAGQFHFEKIRARDVWHLTSRFARKVLAHTLGIFMNRQIGRSDLPFEGLTARKSNIALIGGTRCSIQRRFSSGCQVDDGVSLSFIEPSMPAPSLSVASTEESSGHFDSSTV